MVSFIINMLLKLSVWPQHVQKFFFFSFQAEARQLAAAETNCKAALKASGGCHPPSWALLALLLSARQQIPAALAVAAAALEEAGPAYEGLLLKIKV